MFFFYTATYDNSQLLKHYPYSPDVFPATWVQELNYRPNAGSNLMMFLRNPALLLPVSNVLLPSVNTPTWAQNQWVNLERQMPEYMVKAKENYFKILKLGQQRSDWDAFYWTLVPVISWDLVRKGAKGPKLTANQTAAAATALSAQELQEFKEFQERKRKNLN